MTEIGVGLLAAIAVRTAVIFLALVVGLRATGRRQAGELNLHDVLLVLVLANAVQNAMTRGDAHLSVAFVSAGTLILAGLLLTRLQRRFPDLEPWTAGTPTVLVEDGRLLRRQLRREGVSEEEVRAAVREQGVADLAGVKLVVLEVDGSISVVPRGQ